MPIEPMMQVVKAHYVLVYREIDVDLSKLTSTLNKEAPRVNSPSNLVLTFNLLLSIVNLAHKGIVIDAKQMQSVSRGILDTLIADKGKGSAGVVGVGDSKQ